MNTKTEPLSDDEDSMYATDQEYNSSDSKSIQGVTVRLDYVVCLCGVMICK